MSDIQPHVLMVAAECRDLAKVGGLGDVVRDLAKALKSLHTPISIVIPCYDKIQHPAEPVANLLIRFGARNGTAIFGDIVGELPGEHHDAIKRAHQLQVAWHLYRVGCCQRGIKGVVPT